MCRERQKKRVAHLTSKVDSLQQHVLLLRSLVSTHAPACVHMALCDDATEVFMMSVETCDDEDVGPQQTGTLTASFIPQHYHAVCYTDNAWHHVAATNPKPLQCSGGSGTLTIPDSGAPSQSDMSYGTKFASAPLQSASSHDGSVMTTDLYDGVTADDHGGLDDMQAHDDFLLDNLHDMLASGQGVFSDVTSDGAVLDMPLAGHHEMWMEGNKAELGHPTDIAVGMPVWDTVQGAPVLSCVS